MVNREERITAILSFLSSEALESDLPQQLYDELMAKSDEEFDQVYDNIAKALTARYAPLKEMLPRTDLMEVKQ